MDKKSLIDYCLTYADTFVNYPFDDNWACIRHVGNKKNFAFVYDWDGKLRVNLKAEPIKSHFLRQMYSGIAAGHHMNKEHWNTVTIGEDVPDAELFEMISHSYNLTKPSVKKVR